MIPDGELLRRYADEGSESAFAELVQRHINVVYRAALRRVGGNAHAADDVTQRVFTDLARKAKSLNDRPNLGGWLYTGTRFASAELVRSEQRRRTHEQEAQAMHELDSPKPASATQLDPVLDEVMDLLEERDREAVLLHFFEGQTFSEVGSLLSLSADAARMRVNRALDRLRGELSRRGVSSTSAALATMLASQSGLAAPSTLASAVASNAFQLASNSLGQAGAMTIAGRVMKIARNPTAVSATGAALLVAIAFFYTLPSPTPRATVPGPPLAAQFDRPVPTAEDKLDVLSGEMTAAAENEVAQIVPATDNLPSRAPANEFEALSAPEKDLLKTLWAHEEIYGQQTNLPSMFTVSANHPRYPEFMGARELLGNKGLVRIGPRGAAVGLTAAGMQFVKKWQAELDASPLRFGNIGPIIPPPESNVGDLTAAERVILKRLVAVEQTHPPAAGSRWGVEQVRPDSPNAAALGRAVAKLVSKGWVEIGPRKGLILLTDAGRSFCVAHDLDAVRSQEKSP